MGGCSCQCAEGSRPRFGPKDVVALVCGCLNQTSVIFFVLGLNTLFPDWRDSFLTDRATTSSVQATTVGMMSGGGLVAGFLVRHLGARKSLLLGCVLATVGSFAGGFVTSLPALLVCVGLLAGAGGCMTHIPNMNTCLQRFSSRANFVSSLMTVGAGLAMFVAPFFFRYVTELYSWRGCLIMSSALTMHTFVFSLLLTSPLLHTARPAPRTQIQPPVTASGKSRSSVHLEASPQVENAEEAGPLLSPSQPGGSQSLLETFSVGDEITTKIISQGKEPADVEVHLLQTPVSQSPSPTAAEGIEQFDAETQQRDASSREHEDFDKGLKDVSLKQTHVDDQRDLMSDPRVQDQPLCFTAGPAAEVIQGSTPASRSQEENLPHHHNEITDNTLTPRDATNSHFTHEVSELNECEPESVDHRGTNNTNRQKPESRDKGETVAGDEENTSSAECREAGRVRMWIRSNAAFLVSPVYLVLVLYTMLCYGLVTTFHILILDYTKHQGWSQEDGLLLNSFYLVSNIAGRFLAVALSCLLRSFNGFVFYGVGGVVGGVSVVLLGQVSGYVVAVCLYMGLGVTYSCTVTMFPACILKVTGRRDYSLGLGLVFTLTGVSTITCTTFAGYMVDTHGSYTSLCYIYGITWLTVTSLFLLVTRCGRSTHHRNFTH